MVAKPRVSDARRAGFFPDGTRIVAYISALPMSMPHTRSRYSGSSVTSSIACPLFPDGFLPAGQRARRKPSRWYRPGSRGVRQKLARVLEAAMNGPMGSAPGVRLTRGLRLRPVKNDVTGGTTGYFHAGTASRAAISGADTKTGSPVGAR